MKLAGLQKLTLLDYPGKTAATVFTPGCCFRCPFCHNADLVVGLQDGESEAKIGSLSADLSFRDPTAPAGITPFPNVPLEEFFAFLEKRQGLLDGVCISGGEPLLQPEVAHFCEQVKGLGFAVKLDTNGSFPGKLRDLVESELVDYVAMDVKNAPEHYAETTGIPNLDLKPIRESIDFLLQGNVAYEFRTTVVREYHSRAGVLALAEWIQGAEAWFLQSFIDGPGVLAGSGKLHAWNPEDLQALLPDLQAIVPGTHLRGI